MLEFLPARIKAIPRKWSIASLIHALTITLVLVGSTAHALENLMGGPEPLSPDKAFVPSIENVDRQSITIGFVIADGYYLYRDKMSFRIADPATGKPTEVAADLAAETGLPASLGKPEFPPAITVNDEFFGDMAIYRDSVQVKVPYSTNLATRSLELTIKYQGCADIGLCYPPTTKQLSVELPPALSSPATGAELRSLLTGSTDSQPELLPPELAYLPQVMSSDPGEITVRWQIEPGYYLYRDKLSFALIDAGETQVVSARIDEGIDQFDEFFGTVKIFRESASAALSLSPAVDTDTGQATLEISYQGCADIGVCFPPSTYQLPVMFNQTAGAQAILPDGPVVGNITSGNDSSGTGASTTTQTQGESISNDAQSEQDRLFTLLGSNSLWLNAATFFGLGLLLAFTPCVLPMIPILSSLIVGQGGSMNTGRAFQLSLVYVLVMATTYAAVGIAVGLSGYNVQAFLQNPWVLSAIAMLFVALSLSMFGFYELQLPLSLQTRLTQWSNRQNSGQFGGVAAMGFISTLIVGPCVTAPLAGALIYIAKTGDALIGGVALFALGLGMGAPLLLIGTSAGSLVPKAGAWMNASKHVFGLLMLGMAIYMISRFLPTSITMSLYGVLAVMSGVYLGATDTLDRNSTGWHRFGKGTGLIVSLYGIALLVGSLAGGSSYTTPLRGVMMASSTQAFVEKNGLEFQPVKGLDGLQEVVAQASTEQRPVMLDFYADWCVSCKEMEAFTFADAGVQRLLANAIVIQADVTANDRADQALLKHFDLFGPPGIIFFDKFGKELPAARIVGFMPAEKFTDHLQRFIGRSDI